jgi:hypothetical protein
MRKALLIFAVLGLAGSLWAADPFIGTWNLNVAKSKASDPSWMPKSEIMKSEALDNGLKNTCDGVDSDGKAYHYTWSPKYDGKDYPLRGNPDVDTSAIKKVDANTVLEMWKKAGKEVANWRVTVSKDGMSHTVSGKMKDAKGQEVTFDLVYDKQ